jgi:YD repeat-containing protein
MAVAATLIVLPGTLNAQADFEKGYQAYQSFHGTDFDTVNLANGNLVLNIPLLSYEQRGELPPVVIAIHSNSTTFQSDPPSSSGPLDTKQHEVPSGVLGSPWGQPHVMISPGGLTWQESRVTIEKAQLARFVAIDDSGATHSLAGGIANSQQSYLGSIKYSVDGSDLMLTAGTSPQIIDRKGNVGGLVDPNGNAIQIKGPCAQLPGSGEFYNPSLPSWEGYAHGTASASYIVDSIGRIIPNPSYVAPLQTYSCIVDTDTSYFPDPNRNPMFDSEWPTPEPDDSRCPSEPYGAPYIEQINGTYVSINNVSETYNFPGQGGETIPITFCYQKITVKPILPTVQRASDGTTLLEAENETWPVLTAAILPNKTKWVFEYDNYGQVASVTTPTGSVTSYTYGDCYDPMSPSYDPTGKSCPALSQQLSGIRLACGNPPGEVPVAGTPAWPMTNLMSSRLITRRSVQVSVPSAAQPLAQLGNQVGTTVSGTLYPPSWHYTTTIGSGWGATSDQGTVTVTDPAGNNTVHKFSLVGNSTNGQPVCGPYETTVQYFQGPSQLLKQVDTQYTNSGVDHANPTNFSNYIAIGVLPTAVVTTEFAGSGGVTQARQDVSNYDTFGTYQDYKGSTFKFSMGQKLADCETDWTAGSTPSTTAFRSTSHSNVWQSNYKYYQANLIDLPSLDTTFVGGSITAATLSTPATCTPGTSKASQTTLSYDESAYIPSSGLLGMQTSAARWLSTGSSNPTSHTAYNVQAMPAQKIDPNGNSTTITYDSLGLYPATIQYAYPNNPQLPANSVSHVESFIYDDATGEMLFHTDQNSTITGYLYDSMRRLTNVAYPDNGSESYTYYDTAPPSFAFNKKINGSATYTETGLADTLGRKIETQINLDPDGTTYSDTVYDSLGKVWQQSNPFRSMGDSTYGVTKYLYDSLGRKTVQTQQDGSTQQWCYQGQFTNSQSNCSNQLSITASGSAASGSWVDFMDETGSDWQHNSDGLGRLTNVMEPNGSSLSPTMETDYTYDALNNLIGVAQYGGKNSSSSSSIIKRSFSYDSLSRLIASYNPESTATAYPASLTCTGAGSNPVASNGLWASCYTYDKNGNVISKIDNRGITTSYAYDQLNRVFSKSYSDGKTASSCFQYDTPSTTSNPVGHLVLEWTQKGACPGPANSQSSLHAITIANGPILSGTAILAYDFMNRILTEQQCTLANNCTTSSTPYQLTYGYDLGGNLTSYTNGLTAGSPGLGNGLLSFAGTYSSGSETTGRLQSLTGTWNSSNVSLFTAPSGSSTPGFAPQGALAHAIYGNSVLTLNRTYDTRMRITGEADMGQAITSATPSSATVTITGSERSK